MKCTIKSIAEELNLSRNTVAKALSGKGGVSEKTRSIIQEKAREMNYRTVIGKTPSDISSVPSTILFLTRASVNYSDFWVSVIKGIESVLKKHDYTLALGIMEDKDMKEFRFPANLQNPAVKGIIMVEICDPAVCEAVLQYRLPTVTVDMPRDYDRVIGKLDIVTMENKIHIRRLVTDLIANNCRRFAFVGDLHSSNVGLGHQERYETLCETLEKHGLSLDTESSILTATDQQLMNSNYLVSYFKQLKHLPDVYFCGNDWTAIQVMHAAQFLGYSIPRDFSIVGFDNITESQHTIPPLTTISTPKEQLGIAAANCILDRIQNPDIPHVYMQYMTSLIWRGSVNL